MKTKLKRNLRAKRIVKETWPLIVTLVLLTVLLAGLWAETCRLSGAQGTPEGWETAQMTAGITKELADISREPDVGGAGIREENQGTAEGEDVLLLARLINAEVGTESEECMYACGSVVLNRMESADFPDTLEEVIYQSTPAIQYGCTVNGHINKEPSEICIRVAEELAAHGSMIPREVVYQSEYVQGSGIWKVYGKVVYCYR